MINKKLKYARYEAELTQETMAEKIGVSKGQYYRIENGVRNPSAPVMFRIAQVLNKPVDELFGHLYQNDE